MTPRPAIRKPQFRAAGFQLTDALMVTLIILGIWLSWQVVRQALVQRLPVEAALKLAPGSPALLSRAAEAEYAAGRFDNAEWLAKRSLSLAPFGIRALRVAGLVEARSGDVARADDILTLAGNWSLRDDPVHGWLVDRRLRQGDFASAFAHADTLVRRRVDAYELVFRLFTEAAATDRRALGPLTRLLAVRPPWRGAYLSSLNASSQGRQLAANLALALQPGQGRLNGQELGALYAAMAAAQQYRGLRLLRNRLVGEEALPSFVVDGGFSELDAVGPLGWTLGAGPGLTAETISGPGEDETSLHVTSDGYSSATIVEQLLLLPPGKFRFGVRSLVSQGRAAGRVVWTIHCAQDAAAALVHAPIADPARRSWVSSRADFEIPAEACGAQRLRLTAAPGERRQTLEIWHDDVAISPLG